MSASALQAGLGNTAPMNKRPPGESLVVDLLFICS
jgi:hypothetical protein